MLTTETKRHIDAARQVLVGVVPNPSSQIDQITNALIYKFMDDMDQMSIKAGGKPAFFTGDLERYAWTRLMDSRVGNQERMNIYSEALMKFSESKQLPELFRSIFKRAILPYRSPEVLGLFLKEIEYFDYSHSEELGNAYEYLLSIMGSQGDAGQFRTPRHIIDFIVAAVDPTKDDKVLDPACGTAGFLVSAYRHILEQHDGRNPDGSPNDEKPLTTDQKLALTNNFEGYDVDPGMVRISQVNMYLHQFKTPKIYNYNTLSDDERWSDKFDVIMANPPFMSPKGGVSTHNKFSIESTRSEVLFVDYIINHLRPKGRAGIIVPEGIIFQSGSSHKQLRKNLVEDGLYAVVSLPSGVFQPYSGVKTSILLFNNELAKRSADILFIKIQNDGFDLGATKRPIDKNDLPAALRILNEYKKSSVIAPVRRSFGGSEAKQSPACHPREGGDLAHTVEKIKISATGDYNLSGDRYRIVTDYSNAKWPMVELGAMCETTSGGTPLKSKRDYYLNGTIPWLRSGEVAQGEVTSSELFVTDEGLKNSSAKMLPKNTVLIAMYGATAGQVGLLRFEASTNQAICGVLPNEKYIPEFLYYVLKSKKEEMVSLSGGGAQPNISQNIIRKLRVPLPPLEIQQQIVAELDGYQKIISGARQVVENWKPKIDIDPKWPMAELGAVADFKQGKQVDKDLHISEPRAGYSRFIRIVDYTQENSDVRYIPTPRGDVFCDEKELIMVRYGRPGLVGRGISGVFANNLFKIDFLANHNIDLNFAYYLLNSDNVQGYIKNNLQTSGLPAINHSIVKKIQIPLPSLEIQKQIAAQIESERTLVETAKKLIGIYEQKTKDVLAKLWRE